MFKSFCQADLSTVTTADKRIMLKELKESIKTDLVLSKANKASLKKAKELEKKAKIFDAIKAAEIKLAKLNAKLAG